MSDIEDFGGPINRPASNARQGTAGDLGQTPQAFGQGATDFLGLDGGPDSAPLGQDPFAQPAVPQPVPPSESWLLESSDEAPVTIPRSIAAAQPVEPPALLNTSWSEPASKGSKGRWVGALLGAASLGALALVGYPRLVKRADPVQEQGTQVAQPSIKREQPTRTIDTAALSAVADDLDTPGAIEPADEYSAPLSTATTTPTERVLVGREPEEAQPTTALEENGLVEVVDPTAAVESEDAAALEAARKERIARRRALKAQAAAAKREHELALAAMNADCEPEPSTEATSASLLEIASTLGESLPTEVAPLSETPTPVATTDTTATSASTAVGSTKDEPKVPEKAWPGVSWLDEIEQLVKGNPNEAADESESETSAIDAPPSSDIDTTWLEFEGTGMPAPTNDAEAEMRADAKRERRAAARAARWRAREQALEAARIEHEAALAAMNSDCAQDSSAARKLAKTSNEVFWTPALGELPLPGSWAENAPKAPIFEGSNVAADVTTDETSAIEPTTPTEPQVAGGETIAISTSPVATETGSSEPTPIDTTPVEPAPTEPTPIETTPIETAPIETAPVATAPTETKPVETQPIETKPVEAAPIEPTPVTTTPIETAPVATAPTETKPVETQPIETKPVEAAPIEPTPVTTTPIETAPVATKPVEPAPVEPGVAPTLQPVATAPTTPSEPAAPVLGPPAPNGIPPATPTGVEGAKPEDESRNSGNARVTKLSEQDVVQPTRAQSIVRAAPNDERKGVWDGETIPLDEISRKTRLLTPKVGKVRATLTSGELFEGTLYAVGENCVWLDTTYGRMGLAGSRVKSVVRTEVPKDPAKPDTTKAPEPERVRVKTPGGTLAGQLIEDDGKQAIVLTDSGARLTVDSSTIERVSEQQPAVRVQQRKQP